MSQPCRTPTALMSQGAGTVLQGSCRHRRSATRVIPDSFKQDLLNRVDIVDVIERYVPLKKAGANYVGPAARSTARRRRPSRVSPTKQFYHCFGCGAHGTAIGFLMEYGGMGFVEAVKELAAARRHAGARAAAAHARRRRSARSARPTSYELLQQAAQLLPRAAEELAARHRLPEGARPHRRDRRALRHRLRAGRLAEPGSGVSRLRRQGAGRVRAW